MLAAFRRRWRGQAPHPIDDAWIDRRLHAGRLYCDLTATRLQTIRERHPRHAAATVAAAERILRHEFDLLGSGAFIPVDPDRASVNGYLPIDWYLDPVRKLRFPRGIPYKEWKLYEMRPGNADVKYPWELARCQHWATLGQAFMLTGDERFAVEISRELDDFAAANPVGIGVNWTCTMDVALRAVNWAIGLELVRSSHLESAFWNRAYGALYAHGVFTRDNLENTYEVTSNHFLSNVAGLWFLGAVFADAPQGAEWKTFARTALEREMDVQVLPDGADFESSIPYHRLVTEIFLACARLAELHGEPLSEHYRSRVRDMVGYLAAVTRPDGLMPQVGDADDGRLHVFGGYASTTPQDGRHLFGPAAAMFSEPAWARLGGEDAAWETEWWGMDEVAPAASTLPGPSRLYAEAGVAVMRAGHSHYTAITNGIVGTKGFGNHKHNDQLSFEYHHAGVPLVVDPGSYVYTSDAAARNRFRGTASHNTVGIDDVEQNDLKPEWIFRLFESSNAEHVSFHDGNDGNDTVEYIGRHHGYERLSDPVTHERVFRLVKSTGFLHIVDRLTGRGTHDLRWHFHIAPDVGVTPIDGGSLRLSAGGQAWRLQVPPGLTVSIAPAAYSPSYGVTLPCLAVDASTRTTLDGTHTWEFSITA